MLIETCKGHQRAMGADLLAPRTHTHTHIYTHTHAMQIVFPPCVYVRQLACMPGCASASTQHAGGGAHNLQNITDNRVEINDLILINA